ncbi:phosphatase PAP2 family protein [Burkholderia singularis]|uniref:phosphatase PAP2 family protein n=1 Tax=Burkholderia singularis TaxID=1503053 RepID=UPI003512FD06
MLSASVYPRVAPVCARGKMDLRFAIIAGLTFAFSIGVSRVVLGFHSWSEILPGWRVGVCAAVFTVPCRRVHGRQTCSRRVRGAATHRPVHARDE